LLFCPASRGAPRASGACSPGQGVLFAGEPRNFFFAFGFVSWGNHKPGGSHLGGKAEPRSAASALASFPARRAREKKGRQKMRVTRDRRTQNPDRSAGQTGPEVVC